ncbi:MAG: HD-GYP domain-containing protein [Nitrospiraceae bacterium]
MDTSPAISQGAIAAQERPAATLIESLTDALSLRDPATYTHCQRVASYALLLGRRLGLSPKNLPALQWAVVLHDIGTIHIPDRILRKASRLSEAECQVMKSHVITGYAMLSAIPSLTDTADIVLAHHERYDGTGYPHRLEGTDIPLGARICALVDCLDALTSPDENIRRVFTFPEASRYIASEGGTRFDPHVVDAFVSVPPEEWRHLQQSVSQPHSRDFRPSPVSEPVSNGHFDKPALKVIAC